MNFHGRWIHARPHHCQNKQKHITWCNGWLWSRDIYLLNFHKRRIRDVTSFPHYHCIRRIDTYHESWYGALSNFHKRITDGRHIILTSIAALGEDRSRDMIRGAWFWRKLDHVTWLCLTVQRVIGTYSPRGNSWQENRITFNFNGSITLVRLYRQFVNISGPHETNINTITYICIRINISVPSWWTLLMNFHEILRVRDKYSFTLLFSLCICIWYVSPFFSSFFTQENEFILEKNLTFLK